MKKLELKWVRIAGVVCGAILLSTLGIYASDELSGVSSRLSGSVFEATSVCGAHAEQISFGSHSICMDTYEASAASECTYQSPQSSVETIANIAKANCVAVSEPAREPWRFVTYAQAGQFCARAGKRLPTNEEWHKVSLGLGDVSSCFAGAEIKSTGARGCVTPTGIHDMAGNVWEWMGETVTEGRFEGRTLPASGYIRLVDEHGVVLETQAEGDTSFGEDYAWVESSGVRGMLRGGFYGSGSDGGIFAQNIAAPLDFAAVGVGFRCVRDVW